MLKISYSNICILALRIESEIMVLLCSDISLLMINDGLSDEYFFVQFISIIEFLILLDFS